MLALVQLLIKYALLESFGVTTALDITGIMLLILATLSIAAAGNIINDIFDIQTDAINKPHRVIVGKTISEKAAYNLFIVFNILGVGCGYLLSNKIDRGAFFSLFVIISILLYLYASYLKRTPVIGNLVISILVALSLIIVGIFELIPTINEQNQQTQWLFFKIILDYALFAFSINFLREIAKDIEDINGDYKAGMKTLPIITGRNRARIVLLALSFIPLVGIIYYVVFNLYFNTIAVVYFLIFVIAPLLFISIKSFSAESKEDYHKISSTLKLVMLFGMLSLLLYKYVLR